MDMVVTRLDIRNGEVGLFVHYEVALNGSESAAASGTYEPLDRNYSAMLSDTVARFPSLDDTE